jgi:hypothetical protein
LEITELEIKIKYKLYIFAVLEGVIRDFIFKVARELLVVVVILVKVEATVLEEVVVVVILQS